MNWNVVIKIDKKRKVCYEEKDTSVIIHDIYIY